MSKYGYHYTPCKGGGGGGGALAVTAAVAFLVLGGGASAAEAVAGAVVTLLTAVLVTVAALVAASIPLLIWRARVMKRRDAEAAVAYAAKVELAAEAKRREALEEHRRALEIARAGAPVITTVIDPAALLAAAFAPRAESYRAEVIRGAVER